MRHNLAAYTASGPNYPSYISVNQLEDGSVEFIVRSKAKEDGSCGDTASIVLDPLHPIADRFLDTDHFSVL